MTQKQFNELKQIILDRAHAAEACKKTVRQSL